MDYSHSPRANATASLTAAGSSKFSDGQRLLVIHRRRNAVYAEIRKLVKLRSHGRSCASAKASASLQQADHLPRRSNYLFSARSGPPGDGASCKSSC